MVIAGGLASTQRSCVAWPGFNGAGDGDRRRDNIARSATDTLVALQRSRRW